MTSFHRWLPAILFGIILSAAAGSLAASVGNASAIFDLPLADLMNLRIQTDVASFFPEEDLMVGSSVSVITSDDMRQKGVRRLSDALDNQLSVIQTLNMGGAYITSVRGYTKKTAGGVAMLVDGISISSATQANPFLHVPDWIPAIIDRIEMIKGPGSAIYGSEAFHGVISLKTFESNTDVFHAEGAYASPSYGDGAIGVSKGFNHDRLRMDVAVGIAEQGDQDLEYGYRDAVGSPTWGVLPEVGTATREHAYTSCAGVVKLRLDSQNGVKARLSYHGNRFDSDRFPGGGYSRGWSLRDYDVSGHDAVMDMVSGAFSWTMKNDITVSADAYHWQNELDGWYSFAASPKTHILTYDVNRRSSAVLMVKQPENRFNLQWLIAGAFTRQEVPDASITLRLMESGADLFHYDTTPYEGFSREIWSSFGQIKWAFVKDRAYLLAGGRFDSYDDVGDQFTPRAGIICLPTEKSAVKVLYGRAFNAPSAYNLHGQNVSFMGDTNIRPEIIDVYELIWLYQESDWKLNLTGFFSSWRDGIILQPFNNPDYPLHSSIYTNSGKNHAHGVEASFFRKIDVFAVDLGVAWVQSHAVDIEDPLREGGITDLDYEAFPEYSILLGLYYTILPWSIEVHLNNRVYVNRKTFSFTDARNTAGAPEDLNTYWRTDLNISKTFGGCRIDLNVRNLLDRDNRTPSVFAVQGGIAEPGISVMLSAGYTY